MDFFRKRQGCNTCFDCSLPRVMLTYYQPSPKNLQLFRVLTSQVLYLPLVQIYCNQAAINSSCYAQYCTNTWCNVTM